MSDLPKPEKFTPNSQQKVVGGVKSSKKKLAILFVVLVLITASGVIAILLVKGGDKGPDQEKAFTTLQTEVKTLRNSSKNAEALQKLLAFNTEFPNQTSDQKYNVATELSAIYKSSGDYASAVKWQERVAGTERTDFYSVYELADLYNLAGDKVAAVKAYKQSLELLETDSEINGKISLRNYIKQQIARLEKI
jgi:tetratricopeptide (TPR) repeat protein